MRRRRRRGVSAQDPGAPEEVARASTVRKFRANSGPWKLPGTEGPQIKSSQSVQYRFTRSQKTFEPPFLVNESETR